MGKDSKEDNKILAEYSCVLPPDVHTKMWSETESTGLLKDKLAGIDKTISIIESQYYKRVYIINKDKRDKDEMDMLSQHGESAINDFIRRYTENQNAVVTIETAEAYQSVNYWGKEQVRVIKSSGEISETWVTSNLLKQITQLLSIPTKGGLKAAKIISRISVLLKDFAKASHERDLTLRYYDAQRQEISSRIEQLENGDAGGKKNNKKPAAANKKTSMAKKSNEPKSPEGLTQD